MRDPKFDKYSNSMYRNTRVVDLSGFSVQFFNLFQLSYLYYIAIYLCVTLGLYYSYVFLIIIIINITDD